MSIHIDTTVTVIRERPVHTISHMLKSPTKEILETLDFRPIHPFPARMAPDIALDALGESKTPVRVLDPMVGSGTTLVAARLRGHTAIGFDRDPLAVLIAGAWVTDVDTDCVSKKAVDVLERAKKRAGHLTTKTAYPDESDDETKDFIGYWFDTGNQRMPVRLWQWTCPTVVPTGHSRKLHIVHSIISYGPWHTSPRPLPSKRKPMGNLRQP
jgi:hypothetical protein